MPASHRPANTWTVFAAVALSACLLLAPAAGALADSLAYLGQGGGSYWYLASASDFDWDPGDIIALSGMEQITSANQPAGFNVAYTPWAVTWTCTVDTSGFPVLTVASVAVPGSINYNIQSSDPSVGFSTGPQYAPEPTSILMFCSGLMVMAACVWRRTHGGKRER